MFVKRDLPNFSNRGDVMKSNRFGKMSQCLICAGLLLLVASKAWGQQFTGGPSVRVSPNVSVEFKWTTDVALAGRVEVFNSPDGAGAPIATQSTIDEFGRPIVSAQQAVTFTAMPADAHLFFRVTATDPSGTNPNVVMPTPLPPFFTGVQALSNVSVQSLTTNSATIAWSANVIGFGKVTYGSSQTMQDNVNITDHAIQLTGLNPGTTYQFTASNIHAIDGDALASQSGQFTTQSVTTTPTVVFSEPHAEPRVIQSGQISILLVRTTSQGSPVAGVVVGFAIDPSSAGSGTLSSAQANTDANGIASVVFTGSSRGLVRVQVTSSNATNSPLSIPVVVR
jgi:hypothetical protein